MTEPDTSREAMELMAVSLKYAGWRAAAEMLSALLARAEAAAAKRWEKS